ncbi:MAG: glycosyltransferase family 4 protein [Eubacterium sp.]|nr:glycosyltransferase family 4 protein [Eubacterium sp.]
MKICFVIPSMTGGGAERVTANLANRLDEMGHEVKILMTASDDVAYKLNEGISVNQIGERTHGSLLGRVQRIFTLRRYFKQNKKTVFISMPTDTNMFAILASLFLPVKLIISERNDPNQYGHKGLRDFLYRFAKKMVFQTEDARNCYSKRLQNVGRIIPNPICEENLEGFTGQRSNRFVVVGRLEPQKNHALLLDAYARVALEYPTHDLYLYGKGSLEQKLKEQCGRLGIADRVHFEGFCKDVHKQIADAAAYILSSDYEGISNSLLEAMAMGLPVISTDCPIGGSRMLIEHEKNGLLVPVGDKEALTNAMIYIITNKEETQKMGEEATKVKERFSIEVIADKWLQYMKE